MKQIFFALLLVLQSQFVHAISADVRTSPTTVKSSVFGIVVANDKRTPSNNEQTDRAAKLIVIGNPKDWHTQIKYKALFEMFSNYNGGNGDGP